MKKRIVIGGIIISLLIVTIIYHIPTKIMKNMTVCTLEGEKTEITLEVRWQRSFFKPTELRGSIEIEGVVYRSINDTNMTYYYGSFFEKLKRKLQREKQVPHFVKVKQNTIYDLNDILILNVDSYKINKLLIFVSSNDKQYYGPATNEIEANNIMNYLY